MSTFCKPADSCAREISDTFQTAMQMFERGQFSEAQRLFASVDATDPAYGVAQAFDALCRYEVCRAEMNGFRWFFEALLSPSLRSATLPPDLQEALAFKQIEATYQVGQFDSPTTLDLIQRFKGAFPNSDRLNAISEYELAALVEAGFQRIYDAALDETQRFPTGWTNGASLLSQFLALVGQHGSQNYAFLADRSLVEDAALASVLLKGDLDTLSGIPLHTALKQQRCRLLAIALRHKLHPAETEANWTNFVEYLNRLNDSPASRERTRLMRDLATFAFRTGIRLYAEAGGLTPKEAMSARAKRTLGKKYFLAGRRLYDSVRAQTRPQNSSSGMALLTLDYYNSYCWEQDNDGLKAVTAEHIGQVPIGTLTWLAAKLYHGIALCRESPPRFDSAAVAFDEVLARGFSSRANDTLEAELVLQAAQCRVDVALKMNDTAAAQRILDWVERCEAPAALKDKFLQAHAWLKSRTNIAEQ
jgi:hypothetical protein